MNHVEIWIYNEPIEIEGFKQLNYYCTRAQNEITDETAYSSQSIQQKQMNQRLKDFFFF